MATYKTPGVYIEEISVFPPSVAEVETAIPAFIGYTRKAPGRTGPTPVVVKKIYSFTEYEENFGGAHEPTINVTVATDDNDVVISVTVAAPTITYRLHQAMRQFYDNGGGACYIVSVGDFTSTIAWAGSLATGLTRLALEDEPTLIVVPEAAQLPYAEFSAYAQEVLKQCGDLRDRFAIFDTPFGDKDPDADSGVDGDNNPSTGTDSVQVATRAAFGANNLKYGAAYYPNLRTSYGYATTADNPGTPSNEAYANVNVTVNTNAPAALNTLKDTRTSVYNAVLAELRNHYITMPPSAAVAGLYAFVDAKRGVWKAPANVSVAGVIAPVVPLNRAKQDGLNVDPTTGKSINALRTFAGKGTLIWGARTLAGNDNEWRYVPVRRFFNMVEESVKKSTEWAVFEPNDANTWVKVRGMIEGYLGQKWRDGALAGATPAEAYYVRCGLGSTMNALDILEGRLIVEIGMAVVRPAEFIILKFSHKLQTS